MHPAERYLVNSFNGKYVPPMIQGLLDSSPPQGEYRWLEIGAGRGYLSHRIWETEDVDSIHITDYDDKQVSAARDYFTEKEGGIPDDITIETADATNLPYEADAFDAVLSSLMLHHLDPYWEFSGIPAALDEVSRVLRPGGRLYCLEVLRKNAIQKYLRQAEGKLLTENRFFGIFKGFVHEFD